MTVTPEHIRHTLDQYRERYPESAYSLRVPYELLDRGVDLSSRKEFRGHATAGALLVDAQAQVLVIRHRALDRWLFPGGHVEPEDASLRDAALRELAEEVGVPADSVTGIDDVPVHVDVHPIPANPAKDEPAHQHIDFRFVFRGVSSVHRLQLEEVTDAAWRPVIELDPVVRERVLASRPHGHPGSRGGD